MKNNTITCDRLKQLRKAAGLNQSELGEKLNCQRTRIVDLERGKSTPTIKDITILCKTFNVSADYLLGLTDIKTTDVELKGVCEYTGLTEEAIRNIKHANSLVTEHEKTISDILAQKRIFSMLFDISEYLEF